MTEQPDFDHVEVRDNEAERRYEVTIGGEVAVLMYARDSHHLALIHTEVPKALEGHGIAGKLARFALDDARARGLEVLPICPYVVSYIKRHPADIDLVSPHARHLVEDDEQ